MYVDTKNIKFKLSHVAFETSQLLDLLQTTKVHPEFLRITRNIRMLSENNNYTISDFQESKPP